MKRLSGGDNPRLSDQALVWMVFGSENLTWTRHLLLNLPDV